MQNETFIKIKKPPYFLASLTILLLLICSCNKKDTPLFTSLSASETNIQFKNELVKQKAFGILYYLYYYNGGGVATGDINNDGLADIYFTANSKAGNKLYLNKGNFQFEDITEAAGVAGTADWCTGVTMADVNGDGFLDIYVSAVSQTHNLQGHNMLFINNGKKDDVSFTESSQEYGLNFSGFTTQTAFFDYDHDGDLDCYILNQSHNPNQNILDTSYRHIPDPLTGDVLMRNDLNTSAKKFTDVSAQAGILQSKLGYGLGIAVADLNNDGWDDIYIGNDFHENDYYYVNNGNGTFTESGAEHFRHYSRFSMGNDVADYNNDGQPDIFTADMLPTDEKVLKTYGSDENPDIYAFKITRNGYQYQYSKNALQENNGNGSSFSDVSLLANVSATDWSWCPLFADFDNDGFKDLFVTSGIVKRPVDLDYVQFISNLYMQKSVDQTDKYDDEALEKMPDGTSHPFVFKNNGQNGFTDVSQLWGTAKLTGYFNGAAYADLNNDGTIDVVINSLNAKAVILKNNAPGKNHLSLSFKGYAQNTSGIGTKAYLIHQGKLQYQQLMLTRGFESSSDSRLYFGLDTMNTLDSLLIVWPDQKYQLLKHVAVNKRILIDHAKASGRFDYNRFFTPEPLALQDVSSSFGLTWQHKENPFTDFNIQYLIPHSQSTRGPKLAIADINGDGLDDIFACGAKGQPGTLLLQKNGSFTRSDTAVFKVDALSEDVDAVFFDANGDAYPDLFVVSGGNEATGNDPALLNRLYLNNGKGHFAKATGLLPDLYQNSSCVSVADVDNDGDNDLFVGTLANSRAFGVPQTSYLLINNGGHFSIASKAIINLTSVGVVTSSAFADVNNDGLQDLVVVGEWMPVVIFINQNGTFKRTDVEHSTGLWQTVLATDADADGSTDLLLGNWGFNNKFSSGKNGPLKLFVSDFDGNGQTDQLLSYTFNGEDYPFLAKDEVERSLPMLKKHYLLYGDYAGKIMETVFYGWIDTVKPFTVERLGSAVAYGNGKGGFKLNNLPIGLQASPIFAFTPFGNTSKQYVSGGNFFNVIPYEGRYDAQALALFSHVGGDSLQLMHQQNLAAVNEQVRDLKWIRTRMGKVLVVAGNNSSLLFFKPTRN